MICKLVCILVYQLEIVLCGNNTQKERDQRDQFLRWKQEKRLILPSFSGSLSIICSMAMIYLDVLAKASTGRGGALANAQILNAAPVFRPNTATMYTLSLGAMPVHGMDGTMVQWDDVMDDDMKMQEV